MARIRAQRAGKRRPRHAGSTKPRPRPAPLSPGDLLAVIDEIDILDMTLETVPTLSLLARMMVNVQHHSDPQERDEIARLGFRLRGLDVDYDKGMTALRPCAPEDGMVLDAAMAPDTIVEAVRWRLQRISAVLTAAQRK